MTPTVLSETDKERLVATVKPNGDVVLHTEYRFTARLEAGVVSKMPQRGAPQGWRAHTRGSMLIPATGRGKLAELLLAQEE